MFTNVCPKKGDENIVLLLCFMRQHKLTQNRTHNARMYNIIIICHSISFSQKYIFTFSPRAKILANIIFRRHIKSQYVLRQFQECIKLKLILLH